MSPSSDRELSSRERERSSLERRFDRAPSSFESRDRCRDRPPSSERDERLDPSALEPSSDRLLVRSPRDRDDSLPERDDGRVRSVRVRSRGDVLRPTRPSEERRASVRSVRVLWDERVRARSEAERPTVAPRRASVERRPMRPCEDSLDVVRSR